jgi:hypothetical protein
MDKQTLILLALALVALWLMMNRQSEGCCGLPIMA